MSVWQPVTAKRNIAKTMLCWQMTFHLSLVIGFIRGFDVKNAFMTETASADFTHGWSRVAKTWPRFVCDNDFLTIYKHQRTKHWCINSEVVVILKLKLTVLKCMKTFWTTALVHLPSTSKTNGVSMAISTKNILWKGGNTRASFWYSQWLRSVNEHFINQKVVLL